MPNPQNIEQHKFEPGKSGNPAGRPPGIPNAKTRYKRLLELTSKKANPVTGEIEEFTQLELMDMQIFNKALRGDLPSYNTIMDRLEGKPSQSVDVTSEGQSIVPIYGGLSGRPEEVSISRYDRDQTNISTN
jgi:hypothetical protein